MAPTTVVMLGDVGMGKSSIVETVMGVSGLSSSADESFTKCSVVVESPCRRIQFIDTPGGNSMEGKLEHNVWIAHALNYAPVSMILLTVKADTRIDNTVGLVRNYAERFQDAAELLTVGVTHMDTVGWSQDRLLSCLSSELGLDTAVFIGKETTGANILEAILQRCKSPQPFMINSANFLKLFKINNNNLKILKTVNDEVSGFRIMKQFFEDYLASVRKENDRVDLVFEFQAYMTGQIIEAQKRVSAQNNFTFMGDSTTIANEAGHIANLSNQLRAVLFDIRTMALAYQNDAGISQLRKCPHCGEVWAKLEGCNGETTCGNLMNTRESRFNTMSSFSFEFDGKRLAISKISSKTIKKVAAKRAGKGCGRSINWSAMAPVPVPEEFRVCPGVTTDDVSLIPAQHKRSFDQTYCSVSSSLGGMKRIRINL